MKKEEWKFILGHENYMVSNYGRVYNLKTKRMLKGSVNSDGHQQVTIDGITKRRHQLVAEAFIPNPQNKPEVHHIDKNPANNYVGNLMWVTRKEHAALHPERYQKVVEGTVKKKSKAIVQRTLDRKLVREWSSAAEIQRETNGKFRQSAIWSACNGIYEQAYGYIWEYKESQAS